MSTNCSVAGSPIYQSCDCSIPLWLCAFANLSGYCSTVLWFLVLVPQVWRNFRHRTVEGLSVGWALANFTAALNNSFFVFKSGTMPWYVYGSAVYMPILEGILLVQFAVFTKHSRQKWIATAFCVTVWCALVAVQSLLNVYRQLEWLSIVLWSAETFPQVFLNMRRRSTYGLSNLSVTITAIGKTTDFLQNYLLIMPLQYVIMAFFSSTVAQIGTLQVILYWSRRPDYGAAEADKPHKGISRSCQMLRVIGGSFLIVELVTFAVALVLRTRTVWLIAAPASVYLVLFVHYIYVSSRCPFPWLRAEKADPTDKEVKA